MQHLFPLRRLTTLPRPHPGAAGVRTLAVALVLGVVLAILGASASAARAQTYDMEPHIALSFPFETRGDTVTVKFPVLVTQRYIIRPGDQLRLAYVPLRADDAEVNRARHTGNKDAVLTRNMRPDSGPKLTPQQAATKKMVQETKWADYRRFQLAFANLRASDLRLVYLKTDPVDLMDVHFDFPEGMFLGEIDGAVRVISVEKQSRAAGLGIKAGDVITKLGGNPVGGTLEGFIKAYSGLKRSLETSGKATMAISYRPGGTGAETTGETKAPATLKKSIMDF
ncbi:hypothetical protein DB346_17395 [Verrucomicrobia bacterium LW23]|nr:hypothetical protein DB346_17395 [Verrucomicrobia bacterium LW23]